MQICEGDENKKEGDEEYADWSTNAATNFLLVKFGQSWTMSFWRRGFRISSFDGGKFGGLLRSELALVFL
jgi:hypothetical protein